MRTRLTTGAVLVAAVALAGAALAAPSTLTLDSSSVSGGVATASGTVAFGDAGDGSVGGNPPTTAGNAAAFGPVVGNLTGATITPAGADALLFTWKVPGLPAQTPPELVRYTWSFGVGDKTFQLQAKRSNVASITLADDPAGHVTSAAGGAFQLRGNCGTEYMGAPVSNCPHLAFLSGAFDAAKGEVRMTVPFASLGAKAGDVLFPVETATMSISAAYQAAVSNTTISTYINAWQPYVIGSAVQLATGFAGTDEDYAGLQFTTATVDGATWSGSTPVEEDTDTLVARACTGTVCTYTDVPLG